MGMRGINVGLETCVGYKECVEQKYVWGGVGGSGMLTLSAGQYVDKIGKFS